MEAYGSFLRWLPPHDCRRILIVGAGGFGREVLAWARDAWPDHAHRIQGFLSADTERLAGHDGTVPIVGTPEDYRPAPGDKLLLGIGIPTVRRAVVEQLHALGGEFLTLVHPTAIVDARAAVGHGSVICPYAILSSATRVGVFTLMNYHASLGHDASLGDYCVLSPYATLGGGAHTGDEVFLGLHASLGPGRSLGSASQISANSCALCDVPPRHVVFGVPGRMRPHVRPEP